MTNKRNQHFVPQSYLRKFAIHGQESLVWKFDKTTGRASTDPVSVRKICSKDFYYYQRTDIGKIDHTKLEDAISQIEEIGIKIINSIRKPKHGINVSLCEEKKGELFDGHRHDGRRYKQTNSGCGSKIYFLVKQLS